MPDSRAGGAHNAGKEHVRALLAGQLKQLDMAKKNNFRLILRTGYAKTQDENEYRLWLHKIISGMGRG